MTPSRQVRATFDDATITVYQAYPAAIAVPAAANNSLAGTPFRLNRMTWIKPSFLWMMYRCGWATKPGQEHVLAIQITRRGFEEALSQACLSHFEPDVYPDYAAWKEYKRNSPVRVQWDPERDINLQPLPWRSLQVGLSGTAAYNFANRWIVRVDDITADVHDLHARLGSVRTDAPRSLLPIERSYRLPKAVARIVNADRASARDQASDLSSTLQLRRRDRPDRLDL